MAKALTAKAIEALKPGTSRKEIPDGGLPGLYLIVQPSGAMSWAVRYRHEGKPKKMTLGVYGEAPALGLAEAREEARKALRDVTEGRDPVAEKQRAIEAAKVEATPEVAEADLVENVLDEFHRRHVQKNNRPSSIKESKRVIEKEIKPKWRGRVIQSITRRDVITLLDGFADRGAPVMANRVLALLRKFFGWCVERDILVSSPAANIRPPAKEESRDRVLTHEEIRLVWAAANKIGWPFGSMVQLLLLTGQRRDEVSAADRSEFHLDAKEPYWLIPKERAKNNTGHEVHLTPTAVDIITSLPKVDGKGNYLLSTNGDTPVSGFSRAKANLDAEMLAIATQEATERDPEENAPTLAPWRLHDLRRTVASGMASIGIGVHVIEQVLNHKSGTIRGVAAVYNRHSYSDEKRRALTAWGNYLLEIVGAEAPDNVIRLQGGKSAQPK